MQLHDFYATLNLSGGFSIDDGKGSENRRHYKNEFAPVFPTLSRLIQFAENVTSRRIPLSWFLGDRTQV